LNKDRERKKFTQIIPEDLLKDYNTSKEKTIMNRRIGVKII
jgi:predicted nuclease of restriction endonuclease-like RecB superfamily